MLSVLAYNLFFTQEKFLTSTSQRLQIKTEISMVTKYVNKALSKDLRHMAFSGQPATALDNTYYRFIIPMPGVSANLNYRLPDDTALIFSDFDSDKQPTARALCAYDSAYSGILVDLAGTQRGNVTYTTPPDLQVSGSNPNEISGVIDIGSQSVLALLNLPTSTLWTINSIPFWLVPINDPSGLLPPSSINPECLQHMRTTGVHAVTGMPQYATDNLLVIPLRPFVIGNLTGTPSNVSLDQRREAYSALPLWFTSVKLKSVGSALKAQSSASTLPAASTTPIDTASNPIPAGIIKTLSVHDCQINSSNILNCTQNSTIIDAGPIKRTRIEFGYKVNLDSSSTTLPHKTHYEILRAQAQDAKGAVAHPQCANDPQCGVLKTPPFLWSCSWSNNLWPTRLSLLGDVESDCGNPSQKESLGQLRTDYFSLVKQLMLSSITFRIALDKEVGDETITIQLP